MFGWVEGGSGVEEVEEKRLVRKVSIRSNLSLKEFTSVLEVVVSVVKMGVVVEVVLLVMKLSLENA